MSASDAVAMYRDSAAKFAKIGKVEPHRPVHTIAPMTCGVCRHAIGRTADLDPVHDVAGACACGTSLPPFIYECIECAAKRLRQREAERLQRLAEEPAMAEPPVDVADDDDRDPADHGREANPLVKEAKAYLAEYKGDFDFLRSMKERAFGPKGVRGPLSQKQVEAILKCKKADEERAARATKAAMERVQTGRDLNQLPEGRTLAAVDNDSGGVTFLIIDRPGAKDKFGFPNKWAGWVFVKQQVSDDEVRIGSQRPGESYVGQWANLIDKVLADPIKAVARYGLELGVCGVCARTLTNEESREQGIGPVCLAKLGAGF